VSNDQRGKRKAIFRRVIRAPAVTVVSPIRTAVRNLMLVPPHSAMDVGRDPRDHPLWQTRCDSRP